MTTLRTVMAGQAEEYDYAWRRLRMAAKEMGAQAWRFRRAEEAHSFIEFLEFKAEIDPRSSPALASALEELEGIAQGRTEEWVDANPEYERVS